MRTPPERLTGPRLTAPSLLVTLSLLALAGCTAGLLSGKSAAPEPAVVSPSYSSASSLLSQYLLLLQKLAQGSSSEQAEIVASAQSEYDTAPTPSRQLRLALILATAGHPATDLPRAQGLLRELMANPETLLPGERALAFLTLSQVDDHLTLAAENRRLQSEAAREDRERTANAQKRLQSELDENARLRKDLDEARAKLDAIANIERSLNERKPGTPTPHPP
jgi:hypothetical protein